MSGCRQRFFEPLYAVTQQNKVCALKRDELEIASNDLSVVWENLAPRAQGALVRPTQKGSRRTRLRRGR